MPLCAALNYFKNEGGKILPNKYNQHISNTSPQLRTLQTTIPLSLRSLFPLHSLGSVKGTADLQALEDEAMFGRTWSNRIQVAIQNKSTNMSN